MIQKMLQRELDGNWTIPNDLLLEQLQETLTSCAQKCEAVASRNFSNRVEAQDFKIDTETLKGKIVDLNSRLREFSPKAIDDLDREALTAAFVKTAISIQDLKNKHAIERLFDEMDLVFVKNLTYELDQIVGEVPEGYYSSRTKQLAADVRKLPTFTAFCERLRQFKENFSSEPAPSLAISFSFNDQDMAHLINELLKMATQNVCFFEDDGPKAGREIGAFLQKLETSGYILVIGSSSYGEKARSPLHSGVKSEARVIIDRYNHEAKHVIQFLIEGTVTDSFPSEMAHSQVGYLEATSADKFFSSIARILERAYFHSENTQLKAELEKLKRDFALVKKPPPPYPPVPPEPINLEPLLKIYRQKGYLTRFLDKTAFPIDKSYINLAIVDQQSCKVAERKTHKLDRVSAELAPFDQPQCIELSHLFDENPRVYIEGDAGSGKTTLCHYLAYSWATLKPQYRAQTLGTWANKFEAMIWLPLREMKMLSKEAKLSDLLHRVYPGLKMDQLDPDKTIYILDGFDEVASLEEACYSTPEDKRWEIINSLIDQTHWVMTSRPGLFSEKFNNTRRLKNIGFTDKNISSYIQRFSEDFKISGIELESAVFKSKDLNALAHVPLYLELVCSLWKENRTILVSLSNPVALYDAMAVYLFSRHIKRLQGSEIPLLNSKVLQHKDVLLYRICLEKIAFMSEQLGSNRITPDIYEPIFGQDPLNEYSDEKLQEFGKRLFEDLGILARRGDAKDMFHQDYAFLHSTFEEYFAARHVVSELGSSNLLANGQTASEWFKSNYCLKKKELLIDFIASLARADEQINALVGELLGDQKREGNCSAWEFPLHKSVALGLLKLSTVLIERGAKVGSTDNEGLQPLHLAASVGYKEIVELLLSKNAQVDPTNIDGWLPLHSAALNGHKEVVELLLKKGAKFSAADRVGNLPLLLAAQSGHKEVVKLLLDSGASVEAVDSNLRQPIHLSAKNGHKDVVELLLDYKAKVDAADNDGLQPLHLAASAGHKEVVDLLIHRKALVKAVDSNLRQPIHYAAKYGHKEVLKILIDNKADIHSCAIDKKQPIHFAAENNQKEILEMLIGNGADVEAANKYGWQPIHFAAYKGFNLVVELLLSKGAKIESENSDGLRPLHVAASRGHKQLTELLLSKGAELNALDNLGFLPIYYARQNSHTEIVELLKSRAKN